jgi:hypothetical protein
VTRSYVLGVGFLAIATGFSGWAYQAKTQVLLFAMGTLYQPAYPESFKARQTEQISAACRTHPTISDAKCLKFADCMSNVLNASLTYEQMESVAEDPYRLLQQPPFHNRWVIARDTCKIVG